MTSASTTTFEGWVAFDPSAAKGNMKWTTYEPKSFQDSDIEMAITHCGVCGSDNHTLSSGWGLSDYPIIVGHEIIGHVTRIGSTVKDIKLGDRMGVGAQSGSCLDCDQCARRQEQHCKMATYTYNSKYLDGSKAYGGYAKYWRGPATFAFHIPDGLSSELAA